MAVRSLQAREAVIGDLLRAAAALVGLLPLGAGVLLLTGGWRLAGGGARIGLTLAAGLAAATVLLPLGVYAGLGPSFRVVLPLGAAVLSAGVLRDRLRPRAAVADGVRFGWGPGSFLALPLLSLATTAAVTQVQHHDAYANWSLKARLLFYATDGFTLDSSLFERAFASATLEPPVQRQFPLGLPAVEAYVVSVVGDPAAGAINLLFVGFLVAFVCSVWVIARPLGAPWPLALSLALLLWAPAVREQTISALADVPLAALVAPAIVAFGLRATGDRSVPIAFVAVFAAAAVATKREGVLFVALLVLGCVCAVLARRTWREGSRLTVAALAALAAGAVPWLVFAATHGLSDGDVRPSLARTIDQLSGLPSVVTKMGDVLFDPRYNLIVPLAAAAAILLVVRAGSGRRLGWAYLGLLCAFLAGLALVYVNGAAAVDYLVRTSAPRTLMSLVFVSAALLAVLLERALQRFVPFVRTRAPLDREADASTPRSAGAAR
jgi:hypothetical protein